MMMSMKDTCRVVIVGGGFGGVYTAKALARSAHKKKIQVTLVDRENYFLFTPLLHEVATGGLSPLSVTLPLREVFSAHCNVAVHQGEVTEIDMEKKKVVLKDDELEYDSLVLATGAETNFRGVPGAKENTYPLKTLKDAAAIRDQVIDCFERATYVKSKEEKRELLTFAVVGSGATGVEFAAELADFTCGTLAKYYPLSSEDKKMISVKLLANGPEVLGQFPSKLRDIAEEVLKKKRIDIVFNSTAKEVTENGVVTEGGLIKTKTVVWTAGVKPGAPAGAPGEKRIEVLKTLEVKDHEGVYAVGDLSQVVPDGYPMLAQVASAQGEIVAENIERSLFDREHVEFEYKMKGMIASLGQWMAIGEIYGKNVHGRFMWWLWRTIYLFKFPSMRKRFKVAVEWTVNLFFPRDITKI